MKGSVRKPRSSGGTWSYRIDLGFDESGRWRQREISGFRTKKEAEAALSAAPPGWPATPPDPSGTPSPGAPGPGETSR